MVAKVLDGKLVSQRIKENIKANIAAATAKGQRAPGLSVILVGSDPASEIYVGKKRRACEDLGIASKAYDLPTNTTETELLTLLQQLNNDETVDGIIVQLPLPAHINKTLVIENIHPDKDVDGFHPYNIGRLIQRIPRLRPCTPYGIIKLLEHYKIPIRGLNATVVGASNIVGRPMSLELLHAGATITTCHRFTKDLQPFVEQAELLVVAAGKRQLVDPRWVKPGAIVVDVGIHRTESGAVIGDLDHDEIAEKASWLTPVPGGVGPMTIATLLENTWVTYNEFHRKQ